MKQQSYKEWFDEEGYILFDEILDWLREAPNDIKLKDLLGCTNGEYAYGECERAYDEYNSSNDDYAYDMSRDMEMEEGL